MNSENFVANVSARLQDLLQSRLRAVEGLQNLILHRALPDEDQIEALRSGSTRRKNFFTSLGAAPNAFLLPYQVTRIQPSRSTNRVPQEIEENGATKVSFTREAEGYRIKYFILSPSVVTPEGQRLLAALISILFDQAQLELPGEGVTEVAKLIEPSEQADDAAVRLLQNVGVELVPLYFLNVELKISTSTVLAKDMIVHTRQIQLGPRS